MTLRGRSGDARHGGAPHTSQDTDALGRMAGQVVSAVLARSGAAGTGGLLTQFRAGDGGFVPVSPPVAVDERPPMSTVAEYRAARAGAV